MARGVIGSLGFTFFPKSLSDKGKNRSAPIFGNVLGHLSNHDTGTDKNALVRLQLPPEKREKRRLARAVTPHKTNPLAGLNGEIDVFQQRFSAKIETYVLDAEKSHSTPRNAWHDGAPFADTACFATKYRPDRQRKRSWRLLRGVKKSPFRRMNHCLGFVGSLFSAGNGAFRCRGRGELINSYILMVVSHKGVARLCKNEDAGNTLACFRAFPLGMVRRFLLFSSSARLGKPVGRGRRAGKKRTCPAGYRYRDPERIYSPAASLPAQADAGSAPRDSSSGCFHCTRE